MVAELQQLDIAALIQSGGAGLLAYMLKILADHGKELSEIRKALDELKRKVGK